MKDSLNLGGFLALGYWFVSITLVVVLSDLVGDVAWLSPVLMLVGAAIPVVLFIKGLRKAMKLYLLIVLTPVMAVLLLFGTCLVLAKVG